MAVAKLDYIPGDFEGLTDEPLDDSPVLNTWYHFTINGWSHVFSDIVLKQGGTPLPGAAYELEIDTKYTEREVSESGKTIYGLWRIVDGTYDEIATTISGNNFASYVSNENTQSQLDEFLSELNSFTAADVDYDNSGSGLTATKVQSAIDEIVAGGSSFVPPTLGSETTALTFDLTGPNGTDGFEIENPSVSISTAQFAMVHFRVDTLVGGSPDIVSLYLVSSSTAAEAGSTSWARIIANVASTDTTDLYLHLPVGIYRLYYVSNQGGTGSAKVVVKYKIVDSKLSYT